MTRNSSKKSMAHCCTTVPTATDDIYLHRRLMVSPLFHFYSISKLDLPDDTYVHRPVHCWGGLAQQVSSTSAVEIY